MGMILLMRPVDRTDLQKMQLYINALFWLQGGSVIIGLEENSGDFICHADRILSLCSKR